jgi:solute carrier family 35 protein F5
MLIPYTLLTTHGVYVPRSNLSGTFTFAFSWYLGLEGFTYGKVLGILACFLGAVCVGLNDSERGAAPVAGEHSMAGDMVAFTGAVFYGLYTTTIKYLVRF